MPPPVAPWRSSFLSTLSKTKSSSFTLSTITTNTATNTASPRSRTVEFRGFFPRPPSDLHHSAIDSLKAQNIGLNPDVYESDFLSLTTDVRMKKMGELKEGDEVEGVFWVEEASAQWRVKGRAVAVGEPSVHGREIGSEERQSRERIQRGLRVKSGREGEVQGWDWERAIAGYFANHTPVMRGTFKSPPPGRPRSEKPSDPELKLGAKVEDLNDPVARANFRVLVVCPEEVEVLDFSNPDDVRRTKWVFSEGEQSWTETELWP
ncbi:hypothetical protein BJY04DRAFT_176358 [Aspergillus karnatakaensis]|uniref:uncharacterized protein n=1 Tax=Aspergillus karnatakaensis TaxID=1810916 RepID=UPI003CCD349D